MCGLPVTEQGGCRYVLTCTDAFTRFMWAIPIRDQEAETIVKALMDHVISAFGIPKCIHSDLGRNLTGNVMKLFCSSLGISQSTTTAYHPQGNAYSERGHRFLVDAVAKLSADHPRRWSDYLPAVVLACNSNVNRSTGLSPYECVFGRPPTLPVDVMYGGARAPAGPSPAAPADILAYVCGLQQTLETTDTMAYDASVAAHQTSKTTHDARILEHVYTPGDRVWMRREAFKKGESRKLASVWDGPYRVKDKLRSWTYRVQREGGSKECVVHHNRLKPCHSTPVPASGRGRHGSLASPVCVRLMGRDRGLLTGRSEPIFVLA